MSKDLTPIAAIVPGLPQPLLAPESNPGWGRVREGFLQLRAELEAKNVERLLIYSTMWPSVIGHQMQARNPSRWVHVDELFHDLGSIPYDFKIDTEFSQSYCEQAKKRGLQARTVDYEGFPIDTGSVVALKLLNSDNKWPASIVSSNVYSDRVETMVLARAARDAIEASGLRTAVIIVTSLSNRLHEEFINPAEDKISTLKDHEWNLKILELLKAGRLEDTSQLSRQIHREARVHKVNNFKAFWWLSGVMGTHNKYNGHCYAYEPLYGAGGAVVSLTPADTAARDLEFDEDNLEFFSGDRNVLEGMTSQSFPHEQAEEDS